MTFEPKTSFEPVRRCTYAASRSFKNSKSKAPFKNSQFPLKNRLFLQYFYIIFESEKQKRKRRGNLRKCSGFPCTCRGRVCHCAPAPPVQTLITALQATMNAHLCKLRLLALPWEQAWQVDCHNTQPNFVFLSWFTLHHNSPIYDKCQMLSA